MNLFENLQIIKENNYDEALEVIMDSKPYKRLIELNYQVEIKENSLTIRFPKPDNDIYAHFTFNYDEAFEGYIVRCHGDKPNSKGELIIDDIESYESYEEVIKQCMYYFLNRF